jgi:hypothetical protein
MLKMRDCNNRSNNALSFPLVFQVLLDSTILDYWTTGLLADITQLLK